MEEKTKGEKFTVEELIEACRNDEIEVPTDILNDIASWCADAENKLFGTYHEAFLLYEFSAVFNDSVAEGKLALYYYNGNADEGKDLNLALEWCQKSINHGNVSQNILKAEILKEQKKYSKALECLQKITTKKCSSDDIKEAKKLEKEINAQMKKKALQKPAETSSSDSNSEDSDYKQKDKKLQKDPVDEMKETKDTEEKLACEFEKSVTISTYKGKVVKHTIGQGADKVSVYAFPNKITAQAQEILWQGQAAAKFFRFGEKPLLEGRQSSIIYTAVKKQIAGTKKEAISLDNLSRRSFIVALSKILTEYDGMPSLTFTLGCTIIEFKVTEWYKKIRQRGNFEMVIPSLGNFQVAYGNGCITRLKHLIAPAWNKTSEQQRKTTCNKLNAGWLSKF